MGDLPSIGNISPDVAMLDEHACVVDGLGQPLLENLRSKSIEDRLSAPHYTRLVAGVDKGRLRGAIHTGRP